MEQIDIEATDLERVSLPEEKKTEQDLIDMGNDFREIVRKKNKELNGLKKLLIVAFALVKIMTEMGEDASMIDILYNYLNEGLSTYLNVEEL
tara:strand:+ start:1540 stop:1815 length:276 start_codon:yes stop_codon:yes gene_type:complete